MAKYIEVEVDLEQYLNECIEMLEGKGYKVFKDNEEIKEYCNDWDINTNLPAYIKIIEYLKDMETKIFWENASDDYKKVYEDLNRIVFYEGK